eukprot:m.131333 g.131333  ORF g.131333 m.131333 type:complete len:864 (-) comp11310_c0_seq2:981-3572(-)
MDYGMLCSVQNVAWTVLLMAPSVTAQLAVNVTGDTYTVSAGGRVWFDSAPTWFSSHGVVYSTANGSLAVDKSVNISGQDVHGDYTGVNTTYMMVDADTSTPSPMATSVRVYSASNMAIFTQYFPHGLPAASDGTNDDGLVSSFPAFLTTPWSDTPRGVVSFRNDPCASGTTVSVWGSSSSSSNTVTGTCRITTANDNLAKSKSGYNAWTVSAAGPPRQYMEHPGDFCNCLGNASCRAWPYHKTGITQSACQAECDKLDCKCFDFNAAGGENPTDGGSIGSGKAGTGPIVVFDEDATHSLVVSALNNFMVASQDASHNNTVSYGVMGSVMQLPPGFTLETVVVLSSGINTAMDAWGDVLLARSGKVRDAYRRDYATQWLGYSTDNGAYYYYQTEPNKNYEDTLLDVYNYATQEKIPYKYVLLDSWWYFKGKGGGVATWDPRPDVFPEASLAPFYKKTGWLGQLHNRYWSTDTPYATKNGGKYNFVYDGSSVTCPDDQQFWDDLIANKSTGDQKMFMYEQDWLDDEFDSMHWLQQNASAASTWLRQMNDGCAKSNVTIQYCMSHVRHILQSTELSQVTNARASGDYHPGSSQWNIGTTSVLAHAVGIAPSKDNYWSTPKQNGTHYGPSTSEPHGALQSAVLSLSDGPVCPSDAVGASNASLILRACDASGRLLRPHQPARAIDAQFTSAAFKGPLQGQVWATSVQLDATAGTRGMYSYVLVPTLSNAYTLTSAQLGYDDADDLVAVHQDDVAGASPFDSTHTLALSPCDPSTFDLVTVSPRVAKGSWALLGEPNKWVSVSTERFSTMVATPEQATVTASGPPGETITVAFATPLPSSTTVTGTCTMGANGQVEITAKASPPAVTC